GSRAGVVMVFAEHVADDARALHVRAVPDVVRFVHCEKHAPVDRFQAVAHVREGAPDDHAHGVIEVGAPHLLLEGNREGFFSEGFHARRTEFYHASPRFLSKKGLSERSGLCLNSSRSWRTKMREKTT